MMVRLEQGDDWLIDNPAQKMLREHTAQHEFSLWLKEIYQQDETRVRKLLALCARLEFIDHLSYSARIDVPSTARNTARAEYQLNRLIIYLTTTCVDIAVNEIYGGTLVRRFRRFIEGLPQWAQDSLGLIRTNPPGDPPQLSLRWLLPPRFRHKHIHLTDAPRGLAQRLVHSHQ